MAERVPVSPTICLLANTIHYPEGGGHLWVHLNWALGFRSVGCKVIWLERIGIHEQSTADKVIVRIKALKNRLSRYGLGDYLAVCSYGGEGLPPEVAQHCLSIE